MVIGAYGGKLTSILELEVMKKWLLVNRMKKQTDSNGSKISGAIYIGVGRAIAILLKCQIISDR